MKKRRGLFEGPEWDESRKGIDPNLARFDESYAWMLEHISVEPRKGTTAFMDDPDYRILVEKIPGVAELWVYFRVEPDDNDCTLLWIASRGGLIPFRVG